jgi:hypothetical protein
MSTQSGIQIKKKKMIVKTIKFERMKTKKEEHSVEKKE